MLKFIAGALIGGAVVFAATLPQQPTAYDICMHSHIEPYGSSEQACADALEKEGLIFTCNKTGEICWTERA